MNKSEIGIGQDNCSLCQLLLAGEEEGLAEGQEKVQMAQQNLHVEIFKKSAAIVMAPP